MKEYYSIYSDSDFLEHHVDVLDDISIADGEEFCKKQQIAV